MCACGVQPSHVCADCDSEFIASSRIYKRDKAGSGAFGIGVWPRGRRSVRVEGNDEGWAVLIAGEGAMLIEREAMTVFLADVFAGKRPWEAQEWTRRRGFLADVDFDNEGWAIMVVEAANLFELSPVKTWWRDLGRNPVDSAIKRLSSECSALVTPIGPAR